MNRDVPGKETGDYPMAAFFFTDAKARPREAIQKSHVIEPCVGTVIAAQ